LRSGSQVRITLQLIRSATDVHIWAQSYERDLQDVLALQNDVARDVAHEINLRLAPPEQARLASARSVNREAYDTCLRGKHHLNTATSEQDIQTGINEFERAIAEDPSAPFGYVGLANSYLSLADNYRAPREVFPKAEAATRKALELDPMLSEAHASLGWVDLVYGWNWSAAERELHRAIELNPGNAAAHDTLASYFSSLAQHSAAFAESQRALDLDPLSVVIAQNSGFCFYYARENDRAIKLERRALELQPNYPGSRPNLALALAARSQTEQALIEARRVRAKRNCPDRSGHHRQRLCGLRCAG
jgi:tetratricopeptide (TPR) repeat protein